MFLKESKSHANRIWRDWVSIEPLLHLCHSDSSSSWLACSPSKYLPTSLSLHLALLHEEAEITLFPSAPVPAELGGTSPLNGKKLTSHSSHSPAVLPQTAFILPSISGPGAPDPTRCISKCSRKLNTSLKTGVCNAPPLSVVFPLFPVLLDLTLPPSPLLCI
jgi:hypothetical protein